MRCWLCALRDFSQGRSSPAATIVLCTRSNTLWVAIFAKFKSISIKIMLQSPLILLKNTRDLRSIYGKEMFFHR